MKKSLRNKALREADRLITGTYNGEDWAVPGGWYATKYPIYEGYRVLKRQSVPDIKPDMSRIIDNLSKLETATEFERKNEDGFEAVYIRTTNMFSGAKVNALYYDLLKDLHPDAEIRVSPENKFAPVAFYEDQKIVALLMPLKR